MIRGTEKRVVRVKCGADSKIEEAFLIMKPGKLFCDEDIVNEAEKLIYDLEKGIKKKKRIDPLLPVIVLSLAVAIILYFILR